MRAHVLAEVVAAHERFAALDAPEVLLPGVRAQVALELVGAREALEAVRPAAGEGPLPEVRAQVGLEKHRTIMLLTLTLGRDKDIALQLKIKQI